MPINAHYAGHTRRATLRPPTSEEEVCRARPADSRAHASLSIPPNGRKSWEARAYQNLPVAPLLKGDVVRAVRLTHVKEAALVL